MFDNDGEEPKEGLYRSELSSNRCHDVDGVDGHRVAAVTGRHVARGRRSGKRKISRILGIQENHEYIL